jgi:hypothetical protein
VTIPDRIRSLAREHYDWEPGDMLTDVAVDSLAARTKAPRSVVLRALTRTGTPGAKGHRAVPVAYVRLPERDKPVAIRLAHEAGHGSVSAWVQAWLESKVREAGEGK